MNVINLYQTNIAQIYSRVKSLYTRAGPIIDDDLDVPKLAVSPVSFDKLNRQAYLWTVRCIAQLENVMNELITTFNDNEIIDYDVGDTEQLALWEPESLRIDGDYLAKLKNNFDQCNKLLDQLTNYLQPILEGR